MKRTAFTTLMLFVFLAGYTQVTINKRQSCLKKVELVQLDTVDVNFIYVQIHGRLLSLKMTCSIDYGQKRKCCSRKSKIRLENGKKKMFNSEAAFINYLTGNGWDYVEYDSYAFVFKAKKK